MGTTGQTLSALRTLRYSAAKLADLITGGIDDAEVRSQVRAACLQELSWVDTLLDCDALRLTDAEREAVERAAVWMMTLARDRREMQSAAYLADDAATLRGLLERHAKGGET